MSEIFGAVKGKTKITIISSMAVFAILLVTVIGVLNFVTADTHNHDYDYSIIRSDDGSFNLVGVCKVSNCESPYYAEIDISGVKLLMAESSTCSKEGKRVYSYTKDGITIQYTEKLPTATHTYDFNISEINGVTCLYGKCTADGCTNKDLFVNNVEEFERISTVPGTCFTPRQDTYSYLVNGEERSFVTLVEENIPHTLNGVSADLFLGADGNYPVGVPGIKVSGKVACGAVVDAYYVCEVCKQANSVKVSREDHKFLYDESNLTVPTVSADGVAVLICHNSECTETVRVTLPKVELGVTASLVTNATEASPMVVSYSFESLEYGFSFAKEYKIGEKLSHNYEYELWLNEDTGKFDIMGTCHQPGCAEPEKCIEADVPAEFVEDTSTCLVPGVVIWKYEYKGETLYFDPPSLVTSDHIYAYDPDNAMDPTLESGGLIEIHCTTEGCDHAVVVNLPKVVIGENAEYYGPGLAGRKIYLYTYEYKENGRTLCTIELDIFIGYEEN